MPALAALTKALVITFAAAYLHFQWHLMRAYNLSVNQFIVQL